MNAISHGKVFTFKRTFALALAAILSCSLTFPQLAFATVMIDETELAQGENAVGGGTATLNESTLAMSNVTADMFYTDEDLSVDFHGGNDIDNVDVVGAAQVELNYCGENNVEEVHAFDSSDVTINANGHNNFEEIKAYDQSNLTVNVTGENEFEEITGFDDANITIRGTSCPKKDTIKLGADEEDSELVTMRGSLLIDSVTVELQGEEVLVGSTEGDVRIVTSKIAKGDNNTYTEIYAGGKMLIRESVIDIAGVVHSDGKMIINHSDVKVEPASAKDAEESPYRIYSKTGIKLLDEQNGKVKKTQLDDDDIWYVDTDDNHGWDVDLKANGKPAYYKSELRSAPQAGPQTGDDANPLLPLGACLVSAATAAYALGRREEQRDDKTNQRWQAR